MAAARERSTRDQVRLLTLQSGLHGRPSWSARLLSLRVVRGSPLSGSALERRIVGCAPRTRSSGHGCSRAPGRPLPRSSRFLAAGTPCGSRWSRSVTDKLTIVLPVTSRRIGVDGAWAMTGRRPERTETSSAPPRPRSVSATSNAGDGPGVPRAFDHVFVIMFENQYRSYVLGDPFMRQLSKQGIELKDYFGVMHPSKMNDIASIAGELCNVTERRPARSRSMPPHDRRPDRRGGARPAPLEGLHGQLHPGVDAVGAGLRAAGRPIRTTSSTTRSRPSPGSCASGAWWRRIDSDAALFSDLLNGESPEYAWFTPNVWNDGHWINGTQERPASRRAPALVDQLARWLEGFFARLRFPGPAPAPAAHAPSSCSSSSTRPHFEQDHWSKG